MDRKRGLISFILIFAFAIFSISLISSAACTVTTSCNSDNIVMKLSSLNNAHGELWNGLNYNSYYLCCTNYFGAPTHTCSVTNTILRLSSTTNAHAQIPSLNSYTERVCFGGFSCTSVTNAACPANFPINMLSLSSQTNAHLGNFSTYPEKICCRDDNAPICGDGDVTAGEGCDDGNLNNGDGCSSSCNIEGGYTCTGDPSCCYDVTPAYSWLLNGVAFSGGNIRQNDVLTMRFNEDFCVASGSGSVFQINESSNIRATTAASTVVSGLPGTTTATYTAPLAFLQALGAGTSQISFRTTVGTTTYISNTITVDPMYCGDLSCDNGETCSTCPGDCGQCCGNGVLNGAEACDDGGTSAGDGCSATCTVEPGYTCVGGPSVCTLCQITGVNWRPNLGINAGETVNLEVLTNSACNGKAFTFDVYRRFWGLTDQQTVSTNVRPIAGNGTLTWLVTILDDGTHMLRVTLNERPTITADSADVTINWPTECGYNGCQPGIGENCGTCPADCGCTAPNECISGGCKVPCAFTDAYWNAISVLTGTPVSLTVEGDNCEGLNINFEVWENDLMADDYMANPATAVINSNTATTNWVSVAPDPDGETTPNYYFIATVTEGSFSDSITSPTLEVRVPTCGDTFCNGAETCSTCVPDCGACPLSCGNTFVEAGEECDDGNTNNNDGCSSTCKIEECGDNIEQTWEECDDGNLVIRDGCSDTCTDEFCGDGIISTILGVTESCDDGNTVSGDGCSNTCVVEAGATCVNEPSICYKCGNGTLEPPYEECDDWNNLNGDGCSATCTIEPCSLSSATWSVASTLENTLVNLNVQGSNCNGREITFQILERDNVALGADDPVTTPATNIASYSAINNYGTWTAEMQQDDRVFEDGGNPEYYFTASVTGIPGATATSGLLEVIPSINCVGITLCSQVTDPDMCNSDTCGVGEASQGSGITCGSLGTDPLTGCESIRDCGCYWNEATTTCEPSTSVQTTCPNCGNSILEWDEVCDRNLLQLSDNSCTNFDAYTTGLVSCYNPGTPNECTYNFENCGPSNPSCGNGVLEPPETCDDKNTISGDGCSNICQDEIPGAVCGNNAVEIGEACDTNVLQLSDNSCTHFDEYTTGVISCYGPTTSTPCKYNFEDCGDTNPDCGNGVKELGEECDDDNNVNNDGCSATCQKEVGEEPEVGNCDYTAQGDESCTEGVEFITRTMTALWLWGTGNEYVGAIPAWGIGMEEYFIEDTSTSPSTYRWDPLDESTGCVDLPAEVIRCPALVQLPFFGVYQVIIVLGLVALIYLIYILRKKNNIKNSKKTVKKGKKSK